MRQVDVVVVGGGATAVFTAIELIAAGLSTTLITERVLGEYASTRNQGWLQSGSLFAGEVAAVSACKEGTSIIRLEYPDVVDAALRAFYYFAGHSERDAFLARCAADALHVRACTREEVLQHEPALVGTQFEHFVEVEDRTFDASRLLQAALARFTRLGGSLVHVSDVTQVSMTRNRSGQADHGTGASSRLCSKGTRRGRFYEGQRRLR